MYYEFTFENDNVFTGTIKDVKEFHKHLTKKEKEEFGAIVTQCKITENEYNAYIEKVNNFLCWH